MKGLRIAAIAFPELLGAFWFTGVISASPKNSVRILPRRW